MKLAVIRPEPGNAATVRQAQAEGLDVLAMPLFAVVPCEWDVPAEQFDGLLIGSANALRHAGRQAARLINLPVYAVGETTARHAAEMGFHVAAIGSGGLQALLDGLGVDRPARLLRLAGEEHLPLTVPPGTEIEARITYRVEAIPLTEAQGDELQDGACVLLHSAAAARHFASECDRVGVPRGRIAIAALGPRIARAAGSGWRAIGSADTPDDAALLAFAAGMCQK